MLIIIQQDATICSLFISANCSTCFGWYLHPSSGAHITLSTVTVSVMPDTVDTVIWAPDDGWRYHPKHVEKFADINKLYIVASFWIIVDFFVSFHALSVLRSCIFLHFVNLCLCMWVDGQYVFEGKVSRTRHKDGLDSFHPKVSHARFLYRPNNFVYINPLSSERLRP